MNRLGLTLHNDSYELQHSGDLPVMQLKDPFTHTDIGKDVIPPSMEAAPRISRGLEYLQRRAGNLALTIAASNHGDGDVHDPRELRKLYEDHDAIFFEGFGNTRPDRVAAWRVASGVKTSFTPQERTLYSPYHRRKIAALAGIRRPVYYADIPADGDQYERALKVWGEAVDDFRDMAQKGGDTKEGAELAASINLAASCIFREGYMLGKIGADLEDQERKLGLRSHKPMILIGSFHGATIPPRAEKLGIGSRVVLPRRIEEHNEPDIIPMRFNLLTAVRAGRARLNY